MDEFYVSAFWELSSERIVGPMVLGQIPRHHIRNYGLEKGLSDDTLECFIFVIRSMDIAYLAWEQKRLKAKQAPKEGDEGGGNRYDRG